MLPEAAVCDGRPHPWLHVGGGGDNLGRGHLLHLLQSLLPLGGVQVGGGTLAGNLRQQGLDLFNFLQFFSLLFGHRPAALEQQGLELDAKSSLQRLQ